MTVTLATIWTFHVLVHGHPRQIGSHLVAAYSTDAQCEQALTADDQQRGVFCWPETEIVFTWMEK